MTDEKAPEVAIALSQNLISFQKERRASARTPNNRFDLYIAVLSIISFSFFIKLILI
jgi:hypothetical protein